MSKFVHVQVIELVASAANADALEALRVKWLTGKGRKFLTPEQVADVSNAIETRRVEMRNSRETLPPQENDSSPLLGRRVEVSFPYGVGLRAGMIWRKGEIVRVGTVSWLQVDTMVRAAMVLVRLDGGSDLWISQEIAPAESQAPGARWID